MSNVRSSRENPSTISCTLVIPCSFAAWLTDLTGRREEVRLQAAGPGRYVLDLTGRPQATYLLTLVTADGQERTLRLLKQQDMFGE